MDKRKSNTPNLFNQIDQFVKYIFTIKGVKIRLLNAFSNFPCCKYFLIEGYVHSHLDTFHQITFGCYL